MTERIESLDTLKGLALLAVVVIHVRGLFIGREIEASVFDFILLNSARFGVPIFFLISGFLLKKKFEQRQDKKKYTIRYLRKLVFYYIVATGLYLTVQTGLIFLESVTGITLPRDISMEASFLSGLYSFIYTGYAVRMSLWFFPALIFSVGLIYLSEAFNKFKLLLISAGMLHIAGILTNTYQIVELPIPPRDALFFGLFYTVIGFKTGAIKIERIRSHRGKIVLTSGIFAVINIVERLFISEFAGFTPFFWQDYSFFTLPFAFSIFLLGLSWPEIGKNSRINTYGKYTLWGYILHQIVGGILIGLIKGVELITGWVLIQNSLNNLVITGLTFIITMETVLKYKKDNLNLKAYLSSLKNQKHHR